MIDRINNKLKELKKKKAKYQEKNNKEKVNEIKKKIELIKINKESRVKMKNVSLGTSKQNYIDPRIIFAFIKKYDIPQERLFTEQLLKRFEWASLVDADFRF
jgi:DNA topoisomerase-1